MGDEPFSSSQASGGTDEGIPSPDGFDTLEEYIRSTSRDQDMESSKSLRLFSWQRTMINIINIEENTNMTEVGARAYPMGLHILRDNHKDEIDDVAQMMLEFMKAYGDDIANMDKGLRAGEDMDERTIDQPYDDKPSSDKVDVLKVERSYLSEVQKDYVDQAFMEGWIHRHILSLGLSKSDNKREIHKKKISSHAAAFSEAVSEFRESIESDIKRYVLLGVEGWKENGIPSSVYERFCDISDLMETEHERITKFQLGQIEQYVEED